MLPLDMAPRFAGQLTSFNFSLLMLVSISGPLVVSRMAPNSTVEEWRNVWILIGLVSVFAAIVFAVFGQGAVQPWAESNAEALPDPSQPRVSGD
uniref:Major facilitator superfamily (MFS) profile domain-containing protein n=1 Tax=Biomphalaria glabrata TaxID=6526 RepID=A0A2C9M686_BIOGL